jgi:hypothetical protein
MSIKTVFLWIFRFVATLYAIDGAFKLMTMPNDLAFIAGVIVLGMLVWIWYHVIEFEVEKVRKLLEEKNEKS